MSCNAVLELVCAEGTFIEPNYKESGLRNLANLVRTLLNDYGASHVQFNTIEKETLIDAQKHPEEYPTLMVRVVGACPDKAVKIEDGRCVTDREACGACGACTTACPNEARTMVGDNLTAEEILQSVIKDIAFFRRGSGGITLTGGEILSQPELAIELLTLAKKNLIHRVVETSAYGRWTDLEKIIRLANWVFIDLKHILPEVHRELTGVSNELILENIEKAAGLCGQEGKKLTIRVPVAPGFNDETENFEGTAKFIAALEGGFSVNLLPYHALGSGKYDMIGLSYQLPEITPRRGLKWRRIGRCFCPTDAAARSAAPTLNKCRNIKLKREDRMNDEFI